MKKSVKKHKCFGHAMFNLKRFQALILLLAIMGTAMFPSMESKAAPQEVVQSAIGIDVSKYQGLIDWKAVAASGVQFAMIRVGYRTQTTGTLNEDPYARYNLQEAQKAGIKVGAYFFSTAVSAQEAVEEAVWTCNLIDKYKITYPVAYDCEGYRNASSRQYPLNAQMRTALAITFLDTVAARGYTPMFYNYKNAMDNNRDWDMAALSSKYKVWVASYPAVTFPQVPCNYTGLHCMWQFTDKAYIAGINGTVDMNVAYFNYTEMASEKDPSGAAQVLPVNAANVQFADVLEVVTPNATDINVRTVPDASNPATVVAKISPGAMLYRTGIGNNGWSRVLINNQIFYISTSLLTKIM